jgi:hypothetical protein
MNPEWPDPPDGAKIDWPLLAELLARINERCGADLATKRYLAAVLTSITPLEASEPAEPKPIRQQHVDEWRGAYTSQRHLRPPGQSIKERREAAAKAVALNNEFAEWAKDKKPEDIKRGLPKFLARFEAREGVKYAPRLLARVKQARRSVAGKRRKTPQK